MALTPLFETQLSAGSDICYLNAILVEMTRISEQTKSRGRLRKKRPLLVSVLLGWFTAAKQACLRSPP